jgi:hypothetical protein
MHDVGRIVHDVGRIMHDVGRIMHDVGRIMHQRIMCEPSLFFFYSTVHVHNGQDVINQSVARVSKWGFLTGGKQQLVTTL